MKLQTFDFNEELVRAFLDEQGEPWFCNSDVCRALEIANPRDAIAGMDEEEKITVANDDGNPRAGIPHRLTYVSESGLYQLIFTSRKPEAKTFKRWVTKEVLPAIRKTGGYKVNQASELTNNEATQVQAVIDQLAAAITDKRAGKLSNADASVLANLTCQFLKAYDVKLRLLGNNPSLTLPER